MKRKLMVFTYGILLAVLLSSGVVPVALVNAQGKVWAEVTSASLTVRGGPDTTYPSVGALTAGSKADIMGVHTASGWLKVAFPSAPDGSGWISGKADYVTVYGSLSDVDQIADVPSASESAASPVPAERLAGKLVFQTSSGGDIYIVNADGTGLRKLTTGLDPALSLDGKLVAFARWEGIPRGLFVINVDGTGERLVYGRDQAGGLKAPSWSPDGKRLAFTFQSSGDWRFEKCFSFNVPGPGGKATKISKCFTGPRHPLWQIASVGVNGEDYRELMSHGFSYSPSWAPDGKRIAYSSDQGLFITGEEPGMGNVQDDPNLWRITDYQGDRAPTWSPDGHRVLFQTKSHDHWEVVVINDDGQGRAQITRSWPLADVPVNSVSPAWSPEGKWVVYLTDESGKWQLYKMRPDGSDKAPFLADALKGITFDYQSVDERVISWGN